MEIELRHAPEGISEYSHRRLAFALGRFRTAIHKVRVRFGDVNGPRGGLDKCCRMSADVVGGRRVVVEVVDVNFPAALDRAADRLARAVGREWKKIRAVGTAIPSNSPSFAAGS